MKKLLVETGKFLAADKALWFQFRKHPSWVTRFTIGGKEYGGWYDATGDRRLRQFEKEFPVRASILEMGSLEGGHTFNLAKMPGVRKVVALEGRDYNIRKSEFIRKLLGVGNAEFHLADLEKEKLEKYGSFDVVFSLGLLYHLPEPWTHLAEIRKVTKSLYLWTHYADEKKLNGDRNGYPGWIYQEFGYKDPLSGLSGTSFWPSLDGLKKMLSDAGFPNITIVENDPTHKDGPAITLAARALV